MSARLSTGLITLALCLPAAADELAESGTEFLEKHCASCHGDDNSYPGLDVRDRHTLLNPLDSNERPFIVPGKPEESRLWQVVAKHDPLTMPPEDQDQPTPEEIEEFTEWIKAGAEFPESEPPAQSFIGEQTIASIVLNDLESLPQGKRRFARYFSLLQQRNNPQVSARDLRLTRAAVSKLLNSLSSQPRIAVPTAVDEEALVLRIDLRDYGWTQRHHWFRLLKNYPYALTIRGDSASRLYELSQCDIPYLRADWFVHTAPRPELYHSLATLPNLQGIPETVDALEQALEVDRQANFDNDQISRAGFSGQKSGVSDHNRIVEHHPALHGYYWASYDSAGDAGRQNFSRFPLGPRSEDREIPGAFEHDGGEFIFSLPNGLQGYMLAVASGKRIDVGPQTIVRDPNQFGGSYDIRNGISCMGCHKHGVISFTDTIRVQYEDRIGDIADKVRRIYPPAPQMQQLLNRNRDLFLQALQESCSSFLRQEEDADKPITDFPEPITTTSRKYDRNLFLADVIRELGLPSNQEEADIAGIRITAPELPAVIRFSDSFRRLELLPLTVGEPITRKQWERAFPSVARQLGIGLPLIIN